MVVLAEALIVMGPTRLLNLRGLLVGCVAARVGGEEMVSGTRSPDSDDVSVGKIMHSTGGGACLGAKGWNLFALMSVLANLYQLTVEGLAQG